MLWHFVLGVDNTMRGLRRKSWHREASSPGCGLSCEYRYMSKKRIAMLHDSALLCTLLKAGRVGSVITTGASCVKSQQESAWVFVSSLARLRPGTATAGSIPKDVHIMVAVACSRADSRAAPGFSRNHGQCVIALRRSWCRHHHVAYFRSSQAAFGTFSFQRPMAGGQSLHGRDM